jgi:hypothetical protein
MSEHYHVPYKESFIHTHCLAGWHPCSLDPRSSFYTYKDSWCSLRNPASRISPLLARLYHGQRLSRYTPISSAFIYNGLEEEMKSAQGLDGIACQNTRRSGSHLISLPEKPCSANVRRRKMVTALPVNSVDLVLSHLSRTAYLPSQYGGY